MMISLNRNDRLRLISSPTYVMTAVEEVVSQHWGLQNCKEKEGCWEFKLYGTPWWADGEDSVKARYLIAHIIIKLKTKLTMKHVPISMFVLHHLCLYSFKECLSESQSL